MPDEEKPIVNEEEKEKAKPEPGPKPQPLNGDEPPGPPNDPN